jgi:hypothetical protein
LGNVSAAPRRSLTLRATALAIAVAATATLTRGVIDAHDRITTRVTWNADISRIVQARCIGCHVEGGRGPMPLATYEDARPWARAIKEEVLTRRMPRWHAVRGYGDFSNDPSLSWFEIALIAAWVDGGAPRGPDAPAAAGPPAVEATPEAARVHTFECGDVPLPAGRLLWVRPSTARGGSIGIAVREPDGNRRIVAWIRGYDPEFPTLYALRTPLPIPGGSRMVTEPRRGCSVAMGFDAAP